MVYSLIQVMPRNGENRDSFVSSCHTQIGTNTAKQQRVRIVTKSIAPQTLQRIVSNTIVEWDMKQYELIGGKCGTFCEDGDNYPSRMKSYIFLDDPLKMESQKNLSNYRG